MESTHFHRYVYISHGANFLLINHWIYSGTYVTSTILKGSFTGDVCLTIKRSVDAIADEATGSRVARLHARMTGPPRSYRCRCSSIARLAFAVFSSFSHTREKRADVPWGAIPALVRHHKHAALGNEQSATSDNVEFRKSGHAVLSVEPAAPLGES